MKIIAKVPLILFFMLVSLSTLTETIYSAALPAIADSLNTKGGIAQLSTTAYYCGFAFGILTLGRVSDIFGRRPVVLFGISFYLIASLSLSMVPNIETFIALRFLQACGASVGSVIGQAMVRDSYQDWELSYMYATASMIMAVVPPAGSAIGGYIVEYSGWQDIFRSLSLLAAILLLIYLKFLPETNAYIGVARNNRFFSVMKVVLKDKILLTYAFIVGAFNGLCFGFFIQAPFIFIENFEMPPSKYGKLFFLLSVANLTGSLISRHFIKKLVNGIKLKFAGLTLSMIGGTLLLINSCFIGNDNNITHVIGLIFIPMIIHLTGHSLLIPMLLRYSLEDYYKVKGTAGSIFGFLYYLITAAVSFLIAIMHSKTINNYAMLFVFLITTCCMLFALTIRWKNTQTKPEFN